MSLQEFDLIPPVISRPVRMLMLSWFAFGLSTLYGFLFDFKVSDVFVATPDYFELGYALLLMIGSTTLSVSTLRWPRLTTTWKLEVLGWPPAIAAWVLYLVAATTATPPTLFPLILAYGSLGFGIYRLIELSIYMRVGRVRWEAMQNGKDNA